MEKIQLLKWSHLQPNPYNRGGSNGTRSGFDAKSLKELADSIKEQGIVQPLIVRLRSRDASSRGKKGDGGVALYEIIAGERRWTAAGQVDKKADVPCLVREYDDQQAREINAIENLQRVGLHFLEEAQGFQDLLDLKLAEPYTIAKISERCGKSIAYVYARLKLLKLPDLARRACFNGKLNHSHALLIARIPDPKLALKASLEILAPIHRTEEAALDREIEPLSYRAAKEHVRDHYMVRLKDAPFDTEDAELVPVKYEDGESKIEDGKDHPPSAILHPRVRLFGGACGDCPFRTGNMKALFPDVESEDVCTHPGCFKKKKEADFKRAAAVAKEEGVTILKDNQANRLFDNGRLLETGTGYVDLADPFPGKAKKAWKTVLDESPNQAWQEQVIQARDDQKPPQIHLLLPIALAFETARTTDTGAKLKVPATDHGLLTTDSAEDREAAEAERKQRHALAEATEAEVLNQLRAKVTKLKPDKKFWHYLASQLLDGNFFQRHKLHTDKAITQFLKKRRDEELRAFIIEAVCFGHNLDWQGEFTAAFKAHCKHFGVDWKKIHKRGARTAESASSDATDH